MVALAAEEEVEGEELEEEAVLFGEVAWRGKRSKEGQEEGESEEGGDNAKALFLGRGKRMKMPRARRGLERARCPRFHE